MTIPSMDHDEEPLANPLDVVEQIAAAQDWAFDRPGEDELRVEVPGHWCTYNLFLAWREDVAAMNLTCAFDMRVPEPRRTPVYELLALSNEKLWLGHFSLWQEEMIPLFRHSILLRGATAVEEIEELMDIALGECERFYPAFQFVVWGGRPAAEAVTAAMLDTMGEA